MGSETTAALMQSLLQRKGAKEQQQRQVMGNAMLQTLNSFLTLLENATSGAEVKRAYTSLNSQWKTMNKGNPEAPEFLVSPMDIENAVTAVNNESGATAFLASGHAGITARMLSGELDAMGAVNASNELMTQAGKKFGSGVAAASTTAAGLPFQEDLTNRISKNNSLMVNMKVAMMPLLQDIMRGGVNVEDMQDRIMGNQVLASQRVAATWGASEVFPLGQAKMLRAARHEGIDSAKIKDLPIEEQEALALVGERMFMREVGVTANAQLYSLFGNAARLEDITDARMAEGLELLEDISNGAFGGELSARSKKYMEENPWRDAQAKLNPQEGDARRAAPYDAPVLFDLVQKLARGGVFDRPGLEYSSMSGPDIMDLMLEGVMEGEMKRVTGKVNVSGPDGEVTEVEINLHDALLDEDGIPRDSSIEVIGGMNPDLIRSGDGVAWGVIGAADTTSPAAGDFRGPNGEGYFESVLSSASREPEGSPLAEALGAGVTSVWRRLVGTAKLAANATGRRRDGGGLNLLSDEGMASAMLQVSGQPGLGGDFDFSDADLLDLAKRVDGYIQDETIEPTIPLPPDHPAFKGGGWHEYNKKFLVATTRQLLNVLSPEEHAEFIGNDAARSIQASSTAQDIADLPGQFPSVVGNLADRRAGPPPVGSDALADPGKKKKRGGTRDFRATIASKMYAQRNRALSAMSEAASAAAEFDIKAFVTPPEDTPFKRGRAKDKARSARIAEFRSKHKAEQKRLEEEGVQRISSARATAQKQTKENRKRMTLLLESLSSGDPLPAGGGGVRRVGGALDNPANIGPLDSPPNVRPLGEVLSGLGPAAIQGMLDPEFDPRIYPGGGVPRVRSGIGSPGS